MTADEIREELADIDGEMLLADGLDDALIGYAQLANGNTVAAYSYYEILNILMERDGMTQEEAAEYFDFNIAGAYMGDKTPVYITVLTGVEL